LGKTQKAGICRELKKTSMKRGKMETESGKSNWKRGEEISKERGRSFGRRKTGE